MIYTTTSFIQGQQKKLAKKNGRMYNGVKSTPHSMTPSDANGHARARIWLPVYKNCNAHYTRAQKTKIQMSILLPVPAKFPKIKGIGQKSCPCPYISK